MSKYLEDIRKALRGRHPLIYLLTPEEDRVYEALQELAAEVFPGVTDPVIGWSCVQGLAGGDAATRDPIVALHQIVQGDRHGFFLMRDLTSSFGQTGVVRALRDAYHALTGRAEKVIVIVSAELVVPQLLDKEICLIEVGTPQDDELRATIETVAAEYPQLPLPAVLADDLVLALKGLTINEARHTLHGMFRGGNLEREAALETVFRQKEMIVRKTGFLEFIPPRTRIENIGGLDVLKNWLIRRKDLFTRDAVAQGLPVPKGILLMGVSGCGKSFSAKAVSALWRVPLFRLDMNLVFSGLYGSPEASFHKALQTVEAVAPVCLWIDEIENGLSMTDEKSSIGSSQNHLFSAFLTWMQEKPPLVFIVATANRIQALPAEVIRKGRFDQVFFCDLPNDEERRQIIEIHLRLNGADPKNFKMDYLVIDTEGWNGAEIEQAVVSARIDAHQEGRPFETKDITRNTASMVPLSQTMREQIRTLREWSFGRATPASKAGHRKG